MHTFSLFLKQEIHAKLVPNIVKFNSVQNKNLIHKLNVRDIFCYFQNKKLTQKSQ